MYKIRFLHPLLFAIFPCIFLYSQNLQHFRESVLLAPLFVSLTFAAIVFLLLILIFRKISMAAIFSSAIILIFFSYSRIRGAMAPVHFDVFEIYIGPDKILFGCLALLLGLIIFLSYKYKSHLDKVNEALVAVASVLIFISIFNILSFEFKTGRILLNEDTTYSFIQNVQPNKDYPDIYYFVLDRYGGSQTLAMYGYDNTPFVDLLTSKGFYVAPDVTSNYPKTFLSLGSTLNMEYVNYLTEKTDGGGTSDQSIVTPLVKNNKVLKFLKGKGYSYVHVGSGWDPTRTNSNADVNFVLTSGKYPFADEFATGLLDTTIVSPILKKMFPDATAISEDPKRNDHRSRVAYSFDSFDKIPQIAGPKFVFAHILFPHDPYVNDADCTPIAENITEKRDTATNYINQVACANKRMKVVIDKILSNSKQTPIIIIQADEGPKPIKNAIPKNSRWVDASNESITEKFPIFAAYLLPNVQENPIYPGMTSVNSFRTIFNTYFDANLPILPDKNYIFEDEDNYYKFTEVTDIVKPVPKEQLVP